MVAGEGERNVAERRSRKSNGIYLYKRGGFWWTRVPNPAGGKRLRVSTGCTDRKAAEAKARDLERQAVDPTYRAANETRMSVACERFLAECDDRDLADATRSFYEEKTRHLTRGFALVFEKTRVGDPPLAWIDARAVGEYVELRKSEGSHPHSISKELIALRGVLSLAQHRREFSTDVDSVMPRHFSPKYEPRTNFLEEEDAPRFLEQFQPHRARHVAFFIATAARLSEAARAELVDVEVGRGQVRIRGTKTRKSRRYVPITSLSAPYIYRAIADAPREGPMFKPWDKGGMHRDLKAACLRAGIAYWADANGDPISLIDPDTGKKLTARRRRQLYPRARVVGSLSANDLRRTASTWLLQRGVDTYLISKMLGHVDTKMLERVYGQLDAQGAGRLIEARLAAPIPVLQLCAPAVPLSSDSDSAQPHAQREIATDSRKEAQS